MVRPPGSVIGAPFAWARLEPVAVWRAVGPDEFHDLHSELPEDFEPLPAAGIEATMSADAFVGRVAEETRLDREHAWRATEACSAVLASRIRRRGRGPGAGRRRSSARLSRKAARR